jgi:hypothetical protein
MSAAILGAIAEMPDFDPALIDAVRQEADESARARLDRSDEVQRELSKTEREIANILAAIRTSGGTVSLFEELRRLETRKADLISELDQLARTPRQELALPGMEQLRSAAMEAMRELAPHSYEYGRYMKRLIDKIIVHPYRLFNGGNLMLRASFTLSLGTFVPQANQSPSIDRARR